MHRSILFWKHRLHNVFGHCRKSIEFNPSWIKRILYAINMLNIQNMLNMENMENIQDTYISHCLYKSVARRNGYCFGSSKRKSFTKGPREFGGALLQNLSSMTDM
jgi:hypothetical protein